jgi:hypothetical protein
MPDDTRQPHDNPLVIILLIDGARPDIMRELIASGSLPNIQNEILAQGTFRDAVSCCPSTTGPAYLPFLTGCFPGTMNIPGIRWLDKSKYHRNGFSLDKFRSYNGIEAGLFDRDMAPGHPTLHEIFKRPYNIYSMITRGLDKKHNLAANLKPFVYLKAHITDNWKPVDSLAYRKLISCLDNNPDFIFAVFPGVDSYSHLNHPRHNLVTEAYRYVDFAVGEVAAKLKRLNRWDKTLLLLTSDHGLTATSRHLDLATNLEGRKIKTMYYPIIWKRKPQASVMISGNALGQIYWLDGDRAQQRKLNSGMIDEIKADLLTRDEIDLIISNPEKNIILVESGRGRAQIKLNKDRLSYNMETGDPLGYGDIKKSLTIDEALESSFDSDYPDTMVQLMQLFQSPRSGDLVVVSKNGSDLRKAYEWPEHHSSHGSLHREHMMVPLIYNQRGWKPGPARTTDIFNSVLAWAGKPIPPHTDGRSLL